MSYWVTAYLGLGANIGSEDEIHARFEAALEALEDEGQVRVLARSSVYRSSPWGVTDQPPFLNAVVKMETTLTPLDLLGLVKRVEAQLGRKPSRRWGPRAIDIDILLYAEEPVNQPDLVIPHPHLIEREFVLAPLLELDEQLRLPDGRELRSLRRAVPRDELVRVGRL